MDLRNIGERRQRRNIVRQLLVRPDHEMAVRQQAFRHAGEDLTLQRQRKVGEGDVATEDEIEERLGACDRKSWYKNSIPSRCCGLTQERAPTGSKAWLTKAAGSSRRLVGSKHPSRARASMVSSTSVAMIDSETPGQDGATSRSQRIFSV